MFKSESNYLARYRLKYTSSSMCERIKSTAGGAYSL